MPGRVPALVLHAGAGRELSDPVAEQRARDSLSRIAEGAFLRLRKEGAAKAVVWAVRLLEDDPQFNAGTGAKLQGDGGARLSASLMDGARFRFSGVVNVERVRNPILLAARLQRESDRVLAGEGARMFARRHRIPDFNPITEERWSEWRRRADLECRHGTVGAVAVDRYGKLAAATSTGGKGMSHPHRVGDTATVAGNYASAKAAVSATGFGEEIVDLGLAVRIVTRVEDGASLREAFERTFREARRSGVRAGAIGLDKSGNVAVMTTTPCILHAVRTPSKLMTVP